jgi:5'-nucleotidase
VGESGSSSARIDQLLLPLAALQEASANEFRLDRSEKVYVNRNLYLSHIEWLGFDMDYTLAIYHQEEMDALSVQATVENMIAHKGYPEYLRTIRYDIRFPIRGLLIDKRLGHVLKMDRFAVIHKGYHGLNKLPSSELRNQYWDRKIRPDSERFHWIDTLFGLSEVTSYAAIVAALEERGEQVNFDRLFCDIREAIDLAHANGEIHARILSDLPRFVSPDPQLAETLHKLRSSGKKLFLLTNSPWQYTDQLMRYLLSRSMSEYKSWTQFFNVVVVSARKPGWFQGETPFMELRPNGQRIPVSKLERGHVYEGGHLAEFERLTGVNSSAVLYVGDHIYGDILRSKKHSAWRTAMVIQELDSELRAHDACASQIREKLELATLRGRLEEDLSFYRQRQKYLLRKGDPDGGETKRVARALTQVRASLTRLNAEAGRLEQTIDATFHPYWGSLLKEGGEPSIFGAQVGRYADIYMRRVSCLRHYGPDQVFRSPHDFMPHELGV